MRSEPPSWSADILSASAVGAQFPKTGMTIVFSRFALRRTGMSALQEDGTDFITIHFADAATGPSGFRMSFKAEYGTSTCCGPAAYAATWYGSKVIHRPFFVIAQAW